ncbi:ADP-ribosyl cyclase/cyclic ADP-ribose hydrolase-like isoform X2 [Hydractinia symbiolongicarpus]|uniref:ADP-ribosyl cyclase/cyclic ADP-ribose hydrolase-like isoform X2 n=1 Tax=Hydractinia symbiolongicarpus TaxID=13093 RepID=UPI00254CEA31|nr:ADP-ribosyl cyclase/cyclic ADP-ribose hydrolase-like isoform X2 [Hydractinia symbiolongicarpus]
MKKMLFTLKAFAFALFISTCQGGGTTPNFDSIITGRCFDFQQFIEKRDIAELKVTVNCTLMLNRLKKAFAWKNHQCPSNVTQSDYAPMFDTIKNRQKLENKVLLWTGTKDVAHDFSHVNDNYVTLEDTFAGYIADELTWCGCSACLKSDGIDYETCETSDRKCDQSTPYWSMASKRFAEKAAGKVYVLLNGTNERNPYSPRSIFRTVELPAMNETRTVKHLSVLIISSFNRTIRTTCQSEVIASLTSDAKSAGMKVTCNDNPRAVKFVLCAKYPHAAECKESNVATKDMSSIIYIIALLYANMKLFH